MMSDHIRSTWKIHLTFCQNMQVFGNYNPDWCVKLYVFHNTNNGYYNLQSVIITSLHSYFVYYPRNDNC